MKYSAWLRLVGVARDYKAWAHFRWAKVMSGHLLFRAAQCCLEQQRRDHGAALGEQHVVGAAGGSGVHRLDADARARSAARSSAGAGKRRRAPLPKITSSGSSAASGVEMLLRVSASKRMTGHDSTSPCHGTITLDVCRSPLTMHAPRFVPRDCVDAGDGRRLQFQMRDRLASGLRAVCPARAGTTVWLNYSVSSHVAAAPLQRPGDAFETHRQVEQARQRLLRHPRPGAGQGARRWRKRATRSSSSTSATSPRSGSSRPTRSCRT